MSPPRKRITAALLAASLVFAGCASDREAVRSAVTEALERTARSSRVITYREQSEVGEMRVEAFVEDDLRYQTAVDVGGARVLDTVVSDDALALRLADPGALSRYLAGAAGIDETTALPTEALERIGVGRWTIDPFGAPDLHAVDEDAVIGTDPVRDVVTVTDYVRGVAEQGQIVRFEKNSLEYRPRNDPFPAPDDEDGVVRYDILQPDFPRADARDPSGERPVPETRHFRRMAVYVRDGRVVTIRERIGMQELADEVERLLDLRDPPAVDAPDREERLLAEVNRARARRGRPPIRFRTLEVHVAEPAPGSRVALPAASTTASLGTLFQAERTDGAAGPAGG